MRTMKASRRAILEVRWGPLAFTKAVLEPRQVLRVGRSNLVGLPLPHDREASAEHFELTWDGETCRLRDLESAGGTWLDGRRVNEAVVPNGSWIKAGGTNFMLYVEATTPPPRAEALPCVHEAMAALDTLQIHPGPLFAVIDASRGRRPLQLLREAVDAHGSLYDGVKGDELDHVAPYLVAFRRDSGLLERVVREGWGRRWGIFFSCARPFRDVRRHLRRFLMVEDDESGEKYYFRFYDPRTLRLFLPTCTPRQRADFYGEVTCFFAEGERGEVSIFQA